MYKFKTTKTFKKEVKKIERSGKKNIRKLKIVMQSILEGRPLSRKYQGHKLIGNFRGVRECHIEPDWLLIYKIEHNTVIFQRTGTHAELFL